MSARKRVLWIACALLALLLPIAALAEVVREGDWPAEDPKVSLSVQNLPRGEALKRLAEAAGWSVVLEAPSGDPVDVHVKDQPAGKVLDILLSDRRWLAHREGTLISIKPAEVEKRAEPAATPPEAPEAPAAPKAPTAPEPPAKVEEPPPAPALAKTASDDDDDDDRRKRRGEDRVVTGGSTKVDKDEVVKDLVVMGGSADVRGTVTGDLSVMGGSATVREGAHVHGDATVVGGSLRLEDGARVDGDVGVLGGRVDRGKKAKIGGDIKEGNGDAKKPLLRTARDAGSALTRTSLLFVFGAVLLALATRRMESLETEIAARPMRSFALGIIGAIVGALLLLILTVTLVGIPLAVIGALLAAFAAYAGIAAVLTTAGGALFHHKTKNPYVHLAIGCLLYLVLSSLPWIGGLVTATVVLMGIGAMVATRGAGFVRRRNGNGGPYRSAPA